MYTYLGIWQFSVLQWCHVAPESELLAVESLQIRLPLANLALDLTLAAGVAHNAQLELGHVLQFLVLENQLQQITEIIIAEIKEE